MTQPFTFEVNPPPTFHLGPIPVTPTVWMTWVLMGVLTALALVIRRQIARGERSGLRTVFEAMMEYLDGQIEEIVRRPPGRYFPLIATLFIFIVFANLVSAVPRVASPTADIACTAALALLVFLAVPVYGIAERGPGGYLRGYLKPTPFMLPFNIIGELSRTLALAVRLFGNVMSGAVLAGVLVSVGGIIAAPIGMLGLLTGVIQAYIFAILAMVYIGGAVQAAERKRQDEDKEPSRQN